MDPVSGMFFALPFAALFVVWRVCAAIGNLATTDKERQMLKEYRARKRQERIDGAQFRPRL